MEKKSLKSILEKQPFMKGLKEPYLQLLTGCAANNRFEEGKYLFRAGENADRFYLIRHGRVAVELPVSSRRAELIQPAGPNDLLGWSWLIPPYHWHLAARAMEPVVALSFDGKCIRGKFDKDPELGYEFYRRFALVMAQRLDETFLHLLGLCG